MFLNSFYFLDNIIWKNNKKVPGKQFPAKPES